MPGFEAGCRSEVIAQRQACSLVPVNTFGCDTSSFSFREPVHHRLDLLRCRRKFADNAQDSFGIPEMHITYIHQHFSTPRGATGTRSYSLSRELIEAGHEVTMICGSYDSADGSQGRVGEVRWAEVDGIRVLRIHEPYADRMTFFQRVRSFDRFARAATRVAKNVETDLIFATSTPLTVGVSGMKAARHRRVPFVFEVRDLWPEVPIALGVLRNPFIKYYARRMERNIYAAASRVIALSPGMREGIVRAGCAADRIEVIPNLSDTELFRPSSDRSLDDRFGSEDDCRFVFAGAHGLVGGLDAVLDAVARLKAWGEKGVQFVFIGQGRERDRLIERSRREGLDPWIRWIGPLPKVELAEVLPRMDVGLMTVRNVEALFDASPNKVFDYLASGLPTLMNYPGWLAGLIGEHQCGVVVPPDDPAAFAKAVLTLRDDAESRREMGRRGRELAEQEFSLDKLAPQFVRVLEAAAG